MNYESAWCWVRTTARPAKFLQEAPSSAAASGKPKLDSSTVWRNAAA